METKKYSQKYYELNKQYFQEYSINYRKDKAEEIAERNKFFYENNKEYYKEYYTDNKGKYKIARDKYLSNPENYKRHLENCKKNSEKYYEANKELVQEQSRANAARYYEKNKNDVREKNLARYHELKDNKEICECGKQIITVSKATHLKTKKHIKIMKEKAQAENNNFSKWEIS